MRRIALSLALLGLVIQPALAEEGSVKKEVSLADAKPGLLSFGVFFGGFFASSEHEFYDRFTSEQSELDTVAPDLGFRLGVMPLPYLGVEGEMKWIPNHAAMDEAVTLAGWGGHLIGQLPSDKLTPFAVAGLGGMGVFSDDDELGKDNDFVGYFGLGAKYALTETWLLRADARAITAPKNASSATTAHFEALVGLSFDVGAVARTLPPPDSDGDGFANRDDKCPQEAGIAPDGCPDLDRDKDGIANADDKCPDEAETKNEYEDEDGCADEIPDSDGDGMNDLADSCKDRAEDMDGFQDDDGCPDEDNDGDGVTDLADGCRDEVGPAENRGCPDTDRDGDTVVDRLDNCPDEPGKPENQGCAKKQLVVITKSKLKILDKVFFRTGKAKIRRRSNALLNNVAQVLVNHPDIQKVEVGGHTDDRGSDEKNKKLSQERADAVVAYLVKQGVAAERLVGVGYGEEVPAMEGTNRKAREANRRVEFKVLEQAGTTPPKPVQEPLDEAKAPKEEPPAPPAKDEGEAAGDLAAPDL
jgi:outer membrane protein OmpA-like peptidoglycan-associated protein